jgi:hypothetical protein
MQRRGGISLTPLKGLAVSLQQEMPHYSRFFEDIDILLDSKESGRIVSFLISEGFAPRHNLTLRQAVLALHSLRSINFFSKDSICSIDLHIHLTPRGFPLLEPNMRELLVRKESHNPTLILHLIVQAISCMKDRWQRLDKVIDLALLQDHLSLSDRIIAREILHRSGYAKAEEISASLLTSLGHSDENTTLSHRKEKSSLLPHHLQEETTRIRKSWFSCIQGHSKVKGYKPPTHFYFDNHLTKADYLVKYIVTPTENDIRLIPPALSNLVLCSFARIARLTVSLPTRLTQKLIRIVYYSFLKKEPR